MKIIALSSLAFVISMWIWSVLARRHLRHIKEYEKHSKEFYQNSAIVLDNRDLPKDILFMIAFIAYKMPQTGSAREFLWSIWKSRDNEISLRPQYEAINDYFDANPDVEKPFEMACQAAMRALSFRSLFAGYLVRKLFLFDDADSHDRPAQLVLQAKGRSSITEDLFTEVVAGGPAHC